MATTAKNSRGPKYVIDTKCLRIRLTVTRGQTLIRAVARALLVDAAELGKYVRFSEEAVQGRVTAPGREWLARMAEIARSIAVSPKPRKSGSNSK